MFPAEPIAIGYAEHAPRETLNTQKLSAYFPAGGFSAFSGKVDICLPE